MEALKKHRSILRNTVTRLNNKLLQEISSGNYDLDLNDLLTNFEMFSEKVNLLDTSDKEIYRLMLENDTSEDEIEKEVVSTEEYLFKYLKTKRVFEKFKLGFEKDQNAVNNVSMNESGKGSSKSKPRDLVQFDSDHQNAVNNVSMSESEKGSCKSKPRDLVHLDCGHLAESESFFKNFDTVSNAGSVTSLASVKSDHCSKRKYKLPKIELVKFSGNVKEWLQFWSQFEKIHNDPELCNEDKFQYLLQATQPNSRARTVVESFPATAKNYVKAVESLEARFGRKDLLVETYVRELLKLVMQNLNSKTRMSLVGLYDKLETQIRALESLDVTSETCAAMLYPLIESCLPEDLLRVWERSIQCDRTVSLKSQLDSLMKFLRKEVESEERIALATTDFDLSSSISQKVPMQRNKPRFDLSSKADVPTALGLVSREYSDCIFCNGKHKSENCLKAKSLTLNERRVLLQKKNLCFCCLKPGHSFRRCKSNVECKICHRKHHTMMCMKDEFINSNVVMSNKDTIPQVDSSLSNNNSYSNVMLQTLVVNMFGETQSRRVRVLLDSGSQRSYILKSTAEKMGYVCKDEQTIIHSLFGGSQSTPTNHRLYNVRVKNLDNSYACNFDVLDQLNICSNISPIRNGPWNKELQELGIEITDVKDGPIELLIGADILGKLLTSKLHTLSCGLTAVQTLLGWTLMGKYTDDNNHSNAASVTTMLIKDADISNLWNLDVLGIEDPVVNKNRQELELAAVEHFNQTVKVKEDGRYEVDLPWLSEHPPLPSNYEIAEKRLRNTVSKLQHSNIFKEYCKVFHLWEKEGVIEKVPTEKARKEVGHYLPHRPVLKPASTTPVRPVFDASAKTKGHPSLNDCVEKGKNLIELIPSILVRFRLERIGVMSDIRKAFLQISLSESDRDFLKFLWVDEKGDIKTYRHTRVVFGVSCSPFLLGSVINYHLSEGINHCKNSYSDTVVDKLKQSFYVDNCVTSLPTLKDQEMFVKEARAIFSEAQFDLRGWVYTDPNCKVNKPIPVLGLSWYPDTDELCLKPDLFKNLSLGKVTKRVILSTAHSLFDPIGVSSPVSLLPKLLLQEMWASKLSWDEEVSDDVKKRFTRWYSELLVLEDLRIPRWLSGSTSDVTGWTLHTFCDASSIAYGVAVFLRIELEEGVKVSLLQAKTRVAPKKGMTIPRLELLAALIGARLTHSVLKSLSPVHVPVTYWSDSSTVISWIQRSCQWSVFVRNRVSEILSLTTKPSWKHIPGFVNPADLLSRGCSAKKLVQCTWWEGPEWMKNNVDQWPKAHMIVDEEQINQEKLKGIQSLVITNNENIDWYYRYFSKFNQIVRLIGWIKRFAHNCSHKDNKIKGDLTVEEVENSIVCVVRLIQKEHFSVPKSEKTIKSLKTIKDKNEVLRTQTRITERDDLYDFKCPMILPGNHPVVKRLIFEEHIKNCHAGVQTLMSIIRERFWILKGRKSIRSVIHKCVVCRRYDAKELDYIPGSLPEDRVRDATVFEIVGIDFAGPIFLKGRTKAWICLFTCATYRAIHLELVSSLTTADFLLAFRRFIARRGRPHTVYSDNGTNFTGASNLFNKLNWKEITEQFCCLRIQWKFSPPSAPWWGGWWERMVRTLKSILRKVLGKSICNYEELNTVLCDCEAVVNSRPLTYVSEDVKDLNPLTPAHFLHDQRDVGIIDCDSIEANQLSKRYQYRQKLSQALRKRFRSEYLGQLNEFYKKHTSANDELRVGDVVLISNTNSKRLEWPLAVIEELISGKDNEIRLVKLKTSSGTLIRPIKRICLLETTSWERFEKPKKRPIRRKKC